MRIIVSMVMWGLCCYAAVNTTGLMQFIAYAMMAIFAFAIGSSIAGWSNES